MTTKVYWYLISNKIYGTGSTTTFLPCQEICSSPLPFEISAPERKDSITSDYSVWHTIVCNFTVTIKISYMYHGYKTMYAESTQVQIVTKLYKVWPDKNKGSSSKGWLKDLACHFNVSKVRWGITGCSIAGMTDKLCTLYTESWKIWKYEYFMKAI
jgi:hypothetical protein